MSSRFNIMETPLKGLIVMERNPIHDQRGFFERTFCADELSAFLGGKSIAQINRTLTVKRGSIRGMHFQRPPYSEIKFVNCIRGKVLDIAIDLRQGSPTFLMCHEEILSNENNKTMIIPEGFAHGFQTLTENCEMLYFHTAFYQKDFEDGLNPQDPRLGIQWPLEIYDMSDKDMARPMLTEKFEGITV